MEQQVISFEAAMAQLEDTVKRIESGKTTLDEMVALYEEGMRLAAILSERLDGYEAKIKRIAPAGEEAPNDI